MTVVWRSFLEIYETFKKTNCWELSRPAGAWEDQSRALLEHKAMRHRPSPGLCAPAGQPVEALTYQSGRKQVSKG